MLSLTFGEQVKIVLSRKNMTIKELAEEIEKKTGKKMSRQNLTQRLGRDNFQEQDMRMIAEILGCPFQLNILSDEDKHGNVSDDIYAVESFDERKEKKKKGKTIFLDPQTDLFQRMDELSSSERDITIGELVDIHEQLEQLEQEKMVDVLGETGVLEYEVLEEEKQVSDNLEETEDAPEPLEETEEEAGESKVEAEEEDTAEAITEAEAKEEKEALPEEPSDIPAKEAERVSLDMAEDTAIEPAEKEGSEGEETQEDEEQTGEEKAIESKEEEEPQIIQPESKPVKKKNPLTSVLKGYIRKASKAASREIREPERVENSVKEETENEEPVRKEPDAVPETIEEAKVTDEAKEVPKENTQEAKEEIEQETEHSVGPRRRRGPQMMPGGIGEINPYTGKEYETNSVRMHPNRIGYIQVYDRGEHQWADMTEWAFLGYQERKKALLGDQYEPPIYLD